ncbi:hypothetical protein HU200_023272 [Digitaria exilis]|uniref:CRM domain-containing protein n=1 Tax=Digitaria exilis TaxID=1010633 RepID=A0A835C1A3_9POAL|nr:hypothetical protein HU200_023272 [Digitaria exilis]
MPEFDSFVLSPPGKKGVKPVQPPGQFHAGMEPRYQAPSREELLGEPVTKEEVAELVKGSLKTNRQLNMVGSLSCCRFDCAAGLGRAHVDCCYMLAFTPGVLPAVIAVLILTSAGRDGLRHNMLENIHSHWKRKRVCKIRCKCVCTVDMDNVCQQLEVASSFPFFLVQLFVLVGLSQ